MPIVMTIDPRSGVPIYLQLIEQIKRSVALGVLTAGEQLPTVKQLAVDLTINPNTVARAYRDLEKDGLIETASGRGSFVRADGATQNAQTAGSDVARDTLESAVREGKALGLDRAAVRKLFAAALDRWLPEEV
ncbi:MAG TPA: GntR family transcriptional regulator [Candidatus Baltobacteraceae bacterium]